MEVRKQWVAHINKERLGFDTIFAKDIFRDWDTCRQPEKKADDCLGYALDLRYGQDTTGLADKFLERCLLVVERIFAERRFDAGFVRNDGPSTARGTALRARTFANALLGKGLDAASLCEAASDFVAWALHERWDDHSEDAYLQAVRLHLIAGDVANAADLLRIRKKFKWHDEQKEVLQRVVSCTILPIDDRALLTSFDAVFDPFRPRYPVGQKAYSDTRKTRIDLGAIRDKYFVSPTGEIDWDRTIDAISR
jgi:hypothetical protein